MINLYRLQKTAATGPTPVQERAASAPAPEELGTQPSAGAITAVDRYSTSIPSSTAAQVRRRALKAKQIEEVRSPDRYPTCQQITNMYGKEEHWLAELVDVVE
jgi:hypothetical protein